MTYLVTLNDATSGNFRRDAIHRTRTTEVEAASVEYIGEPLAYVRFLDGDGNHVAGFNAQFFVSAEVQAEE